MAVERTFSIIKPDATARSLTGEINAIIEGAGLKIVGSSHLGSARCLRPSDSVNHTPPIMLGARGSRSTGTSSNRFLRGARSGD